MHYTIIYVYCLCRCRDKTFVLQVIYVVMIDKWWIICAYNMFMVILLASTFRIIKSTKLTKLRSLVLFSRFYLQWRMLEPPDLCRRISGRANIHQTVISSTLCANINRIECFFGNIALLLKQSSVLFQSENLPALSVRFEWNWIDIERRDKRRDNERLRARDALVGEKEWKKKSAQSQFL